MRLEIIPRLRRLMGGVFYLFIFLFTEFSDRFGKSIWFQIFYLVFCLRRMSVGLKKIQKKVWFYENSTGNLACL